MELAKYLSMVSLSERNLADALIMVSDRHDRDSELKNQGRSLAAWSQAHITALEPFIEKYGEDKSKNEQVQLLRGALFHGTRIGGLGALADLQDLLVLANSTLSQWTAIHQGSMAAHDKQLETVSEQACEETDRQISWLKTQVKTRAPQALTVPAEKGSELAASLPKRQTPTSQQDVVWAPTAAGLLMLVVGVLALVAGWLAGMANGFPWLFPSLGPTAYLQAESPAHPASRFYNTVVGHMVGLAAGFAGVFALGAYNDPVVLVKHELTWGRAGAAAIALALTLLVALLLKASHPPAGATTLLVALGAFKIEDILTVVAGVLIVAVAGEAVRRMRLGQLTLRKERIEERRPAPKPKPQT
ncbi:MAG: hypothetical protein QOH93_1978 [Chloroflexia bacterium]|jgi:hypothetical protein|nr:hypothetical protein [Chloroflexia bacterium]